MLSNLPHTSCCSAATTTPPPGNHYSTHHVFLSHLQLVPLAGQGFAQALLAQITSRHPQRRTAVAIGSPPASAALAEKILHNSYSSCLILIWAFVLRPFGTISGRATADVDTKDSCTNTATHSRNVFAPPTVRLRYSDSKLLCRYVIGSSLC